MSFYTKWGENLLICGSDSLFGSGDVKKGMWMTPHHEGEDLVWYAVVSVPDGFKMDYKYYIVDEQRNALKWEALESRSLKLPKGLEDGLSVDVVDTWVDGSSPGVLLSRPAFRKVIFSEDYQEDGHLVELSLPNLALYTDHVIVRFQIHLWRRQQTREVFVTGSSSALGGSELEKAFPLSHTSSHTWEAYVPIPYSDLPLRYKYLLKDEEGKFQLESGDEFEISVDESAIKPSKLILVSDGHFRGPLWRGAGVALPVFSLRTEESLGCGEFLDLKALVDLSVLCGLRLVQLLPINDTSVYGMWWDSYPYSSLSVFALHPIYLRVAALTKNLPPRMIEEIQREQQILNEPEEGSGFKDVDYDGTLQVKLRLARQVYRQEKEKVFASEGYRAFFEGNREWLQPYAAFCFLKDIFGTADHSQWGTHAHFSLSKMERLLSPSSDHFEAIGFTYFLQFHLHSQLTEAAQYARSRHVILKGDLPIGVSRHSVDTWQWPHLFHMDTSTGAPPDQFDPNGQNWGFPTYNWEEMSKDGYAWWRRRLSQLAKFFSAYRIDHILGFFRIWELPASAVSGITGHFRPSLPLTAEEMERNGVWDFNRLSEPYIQTHLLKELFGEHWTEVACRFLQLREGSSTAFQLRPEFDTEKKIVAELQLPDDSPAWLLEKAELFRKGLIGLITNVCLIRDLQENRKFYPRFDMEKTSSFQELDPHTQKVLLDLYQDYYFVRQESLWRTNGLKTLPVMMRSSDMLTCGEDLGFVPSCVPPVLSELGLLGLRIQRMPVGLQEFNDPIDYDYLTVCAPSCHDVSNLRAWWEEDKERSVRFSREILELEDEDVPDACTPEVATAVVLQHCQAPSVWAIFPLQDLMALSDKYTKRPAIEETINDPTNPRHYWRYRVHVTIETFLEDKNFLGIIQNLLLTTGRTSINELPCGYLGERSTEKSLL